MQIKQCPCCGEKVVLTDDQTRYAIVCQNTDSCFFGKRKQPLPIWTVDEENNSELAGFEVTGDSIFSSRALR